MIVRGIRPSEIDFYWPEVKSGIQKALDKDHNRTSIDTVYNNIKNNDMQLWLVTGKASKFSVTTEIVVYDNARQLRIVHAGGGFGDTSPEDRENVFDAFKKFAIHHDCSEIEIWGRDGWLKVCPEFKRDYIIMRLVL